MKRPGFTEAQANGLPPPRRRRSFLGIYRPALLFVGGLVGFGVWGSQQNEGKGVFYNARIETERRLAADSEGARNPWTPSPRSAAAAESEHEAFMAMTPEERKTVLSLAIASVGYACKVNKHVFKGMHRGDAYHLAVCTNGDAFMVELQPEDVVVLDCAIAAVVGADCFAKFD